MHVEAIASRIINGSVIVVTCMNSQILKADEEYKTRHHMSMLLKNQQAVAVWFLCVFNDTQIQLCSLSHTMVIAIRAGWLSHMMATQPTSPNPKLLLVLECMRLRRSSMSLGEESWRCDH